MPLPRRAAGAAALILATTLTLAACGGAPVERESARAAAGSPSTTARPTTTTSAPPAPRSTTTTPAASPAAATGRTRYGGPKMADDPAGVAAQLVAAERAVRDPATAGDALVQAALVQQVAYRIWSDHPDWDGAMLAALPADLVGDAKVHLDARRHFRAMHTTPVVDMPAWRIVPPAPAADLLRDYRDAEAATGVPWNYLAAINLVETAMGRIRGVSVAGAQGPMQFMPSTWAAYGTGDINDPHDAIRGAANYLARNGAPANMASALWRYNHSDHYVRAVTDYAELMRANPRLYDALYYWQVWYATVAGDILLPVGYEQPERVPVADYLAKAFSRQ